MTDAVRPLPDLDGVEIHGHTAIVKAFEDQDGAWADWSVNAYAICAF
jgi:hypothetical protein